MRGLSGDACGLSGSNDQNCRAKGGVSKIAATSANACCACYDRGMLQEVIIAPNASSAVRQESSNVISVGVSRSCDSRFPLNAATATISRFWLGTSLLPGEFRSACRTTRCLLVRAMDVKATKAAATSKQHSLLWFRKGLRLHDNPALHDALAASPQAMTAVFCLDPW